MHFKTTNADRPYVKVANQLARLIDECRVNGGGRLPSEQDLATMLGASRSTVREAILALELSGFVEHGVESGVCITEHKPTSELSDKGIGPFELFRAQLKFETQACGLAASRITEDQIAKLKQAFQEILNESKQSIAPGQAHRRFHCIIAEACQNGAVYSVVDWLWELREHSEICRFFFYKLREDSIDPPPGGEAAIIEALEKRDAETARGAMRAHLEQFANQAAVYFQSLQPLAGAEA